MTFKSTLCDLLVPWQEWLKVIKSVKSPCIRSVPPLCVKLQLILYKQLIRSVWISIYHFVKIDFRFCFVHTVSDSVITRKKRREAAVLCVALLLCWSLSKKHLPALRSIKHRQPLHKIVWCNNVENSDVGGSSNFKHFN